MHNDRGEDGGGDGTSDRSILSSPCGSIERTHKIRSIDMFNCSYGKSAI